MEPDSPLAQKLAAILDIARLAPSVHNTQPWKVSATSSTIIVTIDPAHALGDGDPTGRQTIISLGIFAEAISLAAANFGFQARDITLRDKELSLQFTEASELKSSVSAEISLLKQRTSDRSIYQSADIDEQTINAIKESSERFGVTVWVITNKTIRDKIAELTSRGIALALSSPGFRRELSNYLVLPWSSKKRGIAVKSLYIPTIVSVLQPMMLRLGFGLSAESKLEYKRWLSASAVVVITARGDLSQFWFATGRTYLRASLAIEKAGLSQATSAAIVEASTYHEDIEALLQTNERILAMIRIGSGSVKKHYSPRLDAADLIK